jgi:polyferredoxin
MTEIMDQDKALKKALTRKSGDLPYGFENRVMKQIMLEDKKQRQNSYYRSLALVAFVSLVMVAGTGYVLYMFTSFNLLSFLSEIRIPSVSGTMLGFYFYIATIVLILLGIDNIFRRRKKNIEE